MAAIFDSRTPQLTLESRTSYAGAKRHNGLKAHMAVDTLGMLSLHMTLVNEQATQLAEGIRR